MQVESFDYAYSKSSQVKWKEHFYDFDIHVRFSYKIYVQQEVCIIGKGSLFIYTPIFLTIGLRDHP